MPGNMQPDATYFTSGRVFHVTCMPSLLASTFIRGLRMNTITRIVVGVLLLANVLPFSVHAQMPGKIPITTTVTVLGPKFTEPPPIAKGDVEVFSGNSPLEIIDWVPATGQNG